ncbi:5919_t:CDS:2 [Ambispora leptoticha]|uniref:5919_t:CDS:1 n=1 Tax=Ambispora leptoticha TaxID=144679 RepID=A0A9N8ZKA6_9GLOM|nr:5919_t:CDS:2 [Ambispora leptoticha]
MGTITLNCFVQNSDETFSIEIERNKNINQLKKAIKEKKSAEFHSVDSEKLKIWKVQIRESSVEFNDLILHDDDRLREGTRKISSYFTDEPLCDHIHIIVKPPLPLFKFDLVRIMGLLSEGDIVEYLYEDCTHKATLREGCLCTKDGKYHSFTEFIRAVRKLKLKEKVRPNDFHNLKINGMTYWEVREKLYKLYFDQSEEEDEEIVDSISSEGKLEDLPNTIETVPWNKDLENRLCQLYVRDDVVDIFWGRSILTGETTWSVYVVTRNLSLCEYKEEVTVGQVIHFIPEEKGFFNAEIPPQSAHVPLSTWKKVPRDLQKAFDEALNNELGPPFREAHYNLVGMSTGYKRTKGKFTEKPAIILYVRQKGILRRGCSLFPDKICGYPVDVVEACVATPYGYSASVCQTYQKNVKLGSSIGVIEPQRTCGTLGAVVHDKDSKQIGILSCEHICRFSELSGGTGVTVYQPSHKDLDELKQSFDEMANENEAYKKICENMHSQIDKDKQDSALACYERGMRSNFFSKAHQKNFGIDVAFFIANKNRTLCPNKFSVPPKCFKSVKLPENTCLNGFYTYEELDDIDEMEVFKVGKSTGLSRGKLVPISTAISIGLTNESIKFANEQGEIPPYSNIKDKECFIGYMKAQLFQNYQKCYPTVWFDRQLVFFFRPGDFETGDSGASIMDQKGKALGILHASWMTGNSRYAIASPYFSVFEALDVEFEETSSSVD